MNKLESFSSDRIYHAVDLAETVPGDVDERQLGCSFFYLKSEADKVIAEKDKEIAELKNKINESQTELEKELDGKQHSDYKRCLAMAQECEEAYNRECGLNPEEMTNKEFYRQQIEFWPRWSSKWLELADKFKEAK